MSWNCIGIVLGSGPLGIIIINHLITARVRRASRETTFRTERRPPPGSSSPLLQLKQGQPPPSLHMDETCSISDFLATYANEPMSECLSEAYFIMLPSTDNVQGLIARRCF